MITVQATVSAPIGKVWEYWNQPEDIKRWAFASEDWEASEAENDIKTGGKFKTRMQAKDKSQGFDFAGTYTTVEKYKLIEYTMEDGRKVSIRFETTPDGQTKITESFDPESENSEEMQRSGWQAILDNFKKYVEKEKNKKSVTEA